MEYFTPSASFLIAFGGYMLFVNLVVSLATRLPEGAGPGEMG